MTNKAIDVTATDFSNKRGRYLDDARAGTDVVIHRNNRIAAVMISKERYEKLSHFENIFNEYNLNEKASKAKINMLSRKEADDLTKKLIEASKK